MFFKSLQGEKMRTASPNPEEATKFWSNIWRTNVNHIDQAEWIRRIEKKFQVDKQEDINITRENVAHQVRNMPNWKTPVRDIKLPDGEEMTEPDCEGYKYLGVLEIDTIMCS